LPENKRVIYEIRKRKENNNKQNYRGGNLDEIRDKIKKLWKERKIKKKEERRKRKKERIKRGMGREWIWGE